MVLFFDILRKKELQMSAEKVYRIFVNPAFVVVKSEVHHNGVGGAIFFEVPKQSMTFGLPAGAPLVVIEEFTPYDIIGEEVKVYDIHDISESPDLYARLAKLAGI